MLRKILSPLYVVYFALLFIAGLLVVFVIGFILSLVNTIGARKLLFNIIRWWSRITTLLAFMPVSITGKPKGGRYVVVSNHISYLDAINIFSAKPDYFRALGKIEISKAPLFGLIYKQIVILVDRSSQESRSASMLRMTHALNDEGNVFLYPEGTFNETGKPLKDFYDGAFRLAIAAQRPVLPVIFPDAVVRWHYKHWWTMWPGRNRCIYLPPVPVTGMTIADVPKLREQVHSLMTAELLKAGWYDPFIGGS